MIYSSLPASYISFGGKLLPIRPRLTEAKPDTTPGPLLDPLSGEALLTTLQAAALLGVSARTLEGYRRRGGGPLFVALSRNTVRYRPANLSAWLDSRTAPHTAKARALLAAWRDTGAVANGGGPLGPIVSGSNMGKDISWQAATPIPPCPLYGKRARKDGRSCGVDEGAADNDRQPIQCTQHHDSTTASAVGLKVLLSH